MTVTLIDRVKNKFTFPHILKKLIECVDELLQFRAHEFHYSKIGNLARDAKLVYDLKIGEGISGKKDALSEYNTLASYCHLYFDSAKYATKLVSKRVQIGFSLAEFFNK